MNIVDMRAALHSFDDSGFRPLLDELEQKRQDAFKLFLGVVFVCSFIVILIFLSQGITQLVQFAAFGAFFVSSIFYGRMAKVRRKAKGELMPVLCEQIGLDYSIHPPEHVIFPFDQLSIIPSYDEKKLEDYIVGKVEGIEFKLLEAKLVNVSRDSKGRTSRSTVFNGFLVEFDFHKNFSGQTVITKDHTVIGNFFSGFGKGGDRVKLEDREFEDEFEVHSTDQVEARYLLTPTFMERMLIFSRLESVKQLQLAFKNGSIYMAIKRNGNAFEGGSFKLNDPELIQKNIKDIAMIFDMVIELNLTQNTKI